MYFFQVLIGAAALLSSHTSALHVPRADLVARADVDSCKAILIALKASVFCSSFVPISDVTSTTTVAGSTSTTVVTSTASTCTSGVVAVPVKKFKRAATTTTTTQSATKAAVPVNTTKAAASTSTTKAAITTTRSTTQSVNAKGAASTTSSAAASTSASKCSIKGVPGNVNIFACDIIKQACLAFVKPKTVLTTTTKPVSLSIATSYVTTKCPTTTTSTTSTTTTTTTTTPTTTTSTTTTTTITTMSTTTTTEATTTTTTAAVCPPPALQDSNGYVYVTNCNYNINANSGSNGNIISQSTETDLQACVEKCGSTNGCVAVDYYRNYQSAFAVPSTCLLLSNTDQGGTTINGIDSAFVQF